MPQTSALGDAVAGDNKPAPAQPQAQEGRTIQNGISVPIGYTLEQDSTPAPQPAPQTTLQNGIQVPIGYTLETDDNTPSVTDKQAAYRKATAAGPYAPAGAAEAAMGAEFGDNVSQAKESLKNLGKAALETAGGVGTAVATPAIVDAAISHLGNLTNIVRAAKSLGWTSFGLKEAHDIYKMVANTKLFDDDSGKGK